ncbi:unnamed protein product [Heligmosomoides polygyrus]|uniref:Uncharacterized protein n=1 Tax=Heligmosomoides polygyrus TaxID=6339 RepID=A0A3P8G6G7_HELPZ|nr:unnamed protein product [Heligmosomoides polygyrus]
MEFVRNIEQQFSKEAEQRSDMSVAERFQELYEQWITVSSEVIPAHSWCISKILKHLVVIAAL